MARSAREWRRPILGAVALVAVGAGLGVGVVALEDRLIYYPSRQLAVTPAAYALAYEDVYLHTDDGVRLHAWWLPGPGPDTWLWLHGNAGNISHRLENAALVRARLGASLLLVDYRGYGRSEGRPSEEGTYADAEAALAWLDARPAVDAAGVVVFGRSLGGAVAVELARRARPRAVVVENTFASVPAMARAHYPWLPVAGLLRTRYDSLSKVGALEVPLLVVHSTADPVVPFAQGRELYEAASAAKRFHAVAGAGHYDAWLRGGDAYWGAIAEFLAESRR